MEVGWSAWVSNVVDGWLAALTKGIAEGLKPTLILLPLRPD